jgi:hypothetical protein
MQKVGGIVILIVMPPVNFKITDPNVPTESIISMVDGPPTQSITVKNYDSDNNSALAKVKITRVSNGINQTSSTALNSGKFNNLPLDTYELQSFSDDGRSSEPTQVVLTPTSPSITIDLHFRTIVHVSVDPNGITALNNVKGTLCQVVGSGCTDVGPMTMDANGVFSYGATNLSDGWYGVKIVSYDGPVSDPASKQLSVIKAYPETRYFHLVNSSLPAGGIDLSTITVKEISNYNETVAYDGWGTNSQPPVGFQGLTCNVKDGTTTIMTKVLSAGGVMKLYAGDIASVGTTESGKLTIDKPYTLNCSNPGYKWSPSNPNPTITVHTNTCLMLGVGSYKCGQATVKMSDDNAPGSINVTNYDSIGNPVASGIKITRKSNGVSQVTSSVNSNTFVNLPLDEYDLQSFSDGNFSSDIFPVVLSTTSPTRTIDLRLKGKSATITGEINPGTSATLAELLDSSHNPLYSVTGPGSCGGGFFCLLGPTTYTFKTDVSPGTYYVRITSQGYDTVNYTAIVKTVDDNIDLGLATLVPSQSPLLAPVNEPASAPVSSAPPSLSSIVPTDTPVTSQSLTQSLAPDQSTVVGPTENTNNPVNTPVPTEATVNNKLITGAIIDTNNKPITGADVTLVDSTSVIASSKTNDQGRYSLSSDKIDLSKKYTLKVVKGVDYTKDISFTPKTANANIKIEQNKWFVRLWLRIKSIF